MTQYVISTPEVVCEEQDVRRLILDHNVNILLGQNFYAVAQLDVKVLIGDPNENLSEDICHMLTDCGVLTRTPICDARGKQFSLKDDSLLWDYAWADAPFTVLSIKQLEDVAWDLRTHKHFAHVSSVARFEHVDGEPENAEELVDVGPVELVLPPDTVSKEEWDMYYGRDTD